MLKAKDETIAALREQLEQANERDRENRRIIAALTQRIPEIEPPGEPVTPSKEASRVENPPSGCARGGEGYSVADQNQDHDSKLHSDRELELAKMHLDAFMHITTFCSGAILLSATVWARSSRSRAGCGCCR